MVAETQTTEVLGELVDAAPPPAALYPRVRQMVAETPWAITPGKLAAILEVLDLRAQGLRFTAEEIRERVGAAASRSEPRRSGAVAVLPIYGVLSQRADLLTESSGGASTDRVTGQFRQLLADPSIGSIVLDVDSPGGTVYGVEELASVIYGARGTKPVVAVANSMAASAAYWIATAADELVVTPGGQVGSIGVLLAHTETSVLDERLGLKTSVISAGKFKSEANPYEPLGDEARAALQEKVDLYYAAFTKAVARHRGVGVEAVRSGFGQGRVVNARPAVEAGMADRVATLDETIQRMASGRARRGGTRAEAPGASLELRRRRLRLHGATG